MAKEMTRDNYEQLLLKLLHDIEALQPALGTKTKDQLLELWMHRDEHGRYNEPVYQYAIKVALKRIYNVEAPLYPYDPMTPQQRFALQPSYIVAATEQRVRGAVTQDAAHVFDILERHKFILDEQTRSRLIEARVHQEMSENPHKYWKH